MGIVDTNPGLASNRNPVLRRSILDTELDTTRPWDDLLR
jgi:hypothetical protein